MLKSIRTYLLVILALLVIFPIIQMQWHIITPVPLQGAFIAPPSPHLTPDDFWQGKFQSEVKNYVKYNHPFQPELVRLYNQINFDLFHEVNTLLSVQKNGYLFDPKSISSANGDDYLGDEKWQSHLRKSDQVIHYLRQKNISVIFILAPNKAVYHHQQLRTPLHPSTTNVQLIRNWIKRQKIPVIDTEYLFEQVQTAYPLYPKHAAHWSIYGASLVADSLMQLMHQLDNSVQFKSKVFQMDTTVIPRFTDNDYTRMLNLMTPPTETPLIYPTIGYQARPTPRIHAVGDSYFWSFYDLAFFQKIAHPTSKFVYYNNTSYDTDRNQVAHRELQLQDLEELDYVIICTGHENLTDWTFGFTDHLFSLMQSAQNGI